MLSKVLFTLPSGSPIVLDYPFGIAEDGFQDLGFRPARTLMWMGFTL